MLSRWGLLIYVRQGNSAAVFDEALDHHSGGFLDDQLGLIGEGQDGVRSLLDRNKHFRVDEEAFTIQASDRNHS